MAVLKLRPDADVQGDEAPHRAPEDNGRQLPATKDMKRSRGGRTAKAASAKAVAAKGGVVPLHMEALPPPGSRRDEDAPASKFDAGPMAFELKDEFVSSAARVSLSSTPCMGDGTVVGTPSAGGGCVDAGGNGSIVTGGGASSVGHRCGMATLCHWCRHPAPALGNGLTGQLISMPMRKQWARGGRSSCTVSDNPSMAVNQVTSSPSFVCHGAYCSLECMSASNRDRFGRDASWSHLLQVESLINEMAYVNFGYRTPVVPAPHWTTLDVFGGKLTIREFRARCRSGGGGGEKTAGDEQQQDGAGSCIMLRNHFPMVERQPTIQEVSVDELLTNKHTFVPIDDARVNRFKSNLRLKRTKPLARAGNLHASMNLTTRRG